MVFTEFGRRVEENGSLGTDHGTATPMFIIGKGVRGGFYSKHPSLTDLDDGNMKMTTDFRRVYATMIKEWLGYADVGAVLKGNFGAARRICVKANLKVRTTPDSRSADLQVRRSNTPSSIFNSASRLSRSLKIVATANTRDPRRYATVQSCSSNTPSMSVASHDSA